MNKRNKNEIINRIENCICELLNRKRSAIRTIDIPLNVFRNLVWDDTMNSGSKLAQELQTFADSPDSYQPMHMYPAGVLTRDYVRPTLEIINQKVREHNSSSLSLPCIVESVYDNKAHHQLIAYRFSLSREYFVALCLYPILQKRCLSIPIGTLSELIKTPENTVSLLKNKIGAHTLFSKEEQAAFTSDHVIPILNYLNEIAADNSAGTRYNMVISCIPQIHQDAYTVIYNFNVNGPNMSDINDETYINLKSNLPFAFYKMSKWAYLIHLYLMNLFQNLEVPDSKDENNDSSQNYLVEKLDAREVWEFWYNSPINSNSYFSEFAKAVDELQDIYISIKALGKSKRIYVLPEYFARKHSDHYKLYEKWDFINKKYYVHINSAFANYFVNPDRCLNYPKVLAHIFPRTGYSQIRLFELLYSSLPYTSGIGEIKNISIYKLAITTGKIDIIDLRVRYIDLATAEFMKKVYADFIKNNPCFAQNLNDLFIQPSIKLLNTKLAEWNYNLKYAAEFSKNSDTEITFTLIPTGKASE